MDLCRLLICTFGVLLATVSIAGERHPCKINQLVVKKQDGSTSCIDCLVCPPGQGFSHICGSSDAEIPEDEVKNLKCVDCVPSATFSASNDSTQCAQCGTCFEDRVVKENCSLVSPTKCGSSCYSKTNYLRKSSEKCEPCSTCCNDSHDEVVDECIQKGNAVDQSCSIDHHCNPAPTQPSTTNGQATTPVAGSTWGLSNQEGSKHVTSSTKKPMAAIIASLSVASFIVLLVLWWRLCAKKQLPECCLEQLTDDLERGNHRVAFESRTQRVTLPDHRSNPNRVSCMERGRAVRPVTTIQHQTVPAFENTAQQAPNFTDASNPIGQMKLSDFADIQFLRYEKVCRALDTKIPKRGNYEHVAKHYGMDSYTLSSFKDDKERGPSQIMFEWLKCGKPNLTVGEFVKVLQMEGIGRNDVVVMFYQ